MEAVVRKVSIIFQNNGKKFKQTSKQSRTMPYILGKNEIFTLICIIELINVAIYLIYRRLTKNRKPRQYNSFAQTEEIFTNTNQTQTDFPSNFITSTNINSPIKSQTSSFNQSKVSSSDLIIINK